MAGLIQGMDKNEQISLKDRIANMAEYEAIDASREISVPGMFGTYGTDEEYPVGWELMQETILPATFDNDR